MRAVDSNGHENESSLYQYCLNKDDENYNDIQEVNELEIFYNKLINLLASECNILTIKVKFSDNNYNKFSDYSRGLKIIFTEKFFQLYNSMFNFNIKLHYLKSNVESIDIFRIKKEILSNINYFSYNKDEFSIENSSLL